MEDENGGTPPAPHVQEYENGIFNLVVSLIQHLSQQYDPETARKFVANYLTRLADGLISIPNTKDGNTHEHGSEEFR